MTKLSKGRGKDQRRQGRRCYFLSLLKRNLTMICDFQPLRTDISISGESAQLHSRRVLKARPSLTSADEGADQPYQFPHSLVLTLDRCLNHPTNHKPPEPHLRAWLDLPDDFRPLSKRFVKECCSAAESNGVRFASYARNRLKAPSNFRQFPSQLSHHASQE